MVLIYCIEDINGLKYVGSTKRNMYVRFREHYSQKKMNTSHCTSKKLDLLNCEIYELEWCDDSNRKEREKHWINKLDCVNELKYNYDEKEYNKSDRRKEVHRKHRNKNKDRNKKKLQEYDKERNLFRRKRVVNGCYEFIQMLNEY